MLLDAQSAFIMFYSQRNTETIVRFVIYCQVCDTLRVVFFLLIFKEDNFFIYFQETHQQLADKTKYYVVELSDQYKVPTVLAEPSHGEINETPIENFDLARHYMGKSQVHFYNCCLLLAGVMGQELLLAIG